MKKSGSKSQTLKCSPGRKNGRRESKFGYVVGNFLLFKKGAASHTKIFNRFRDIRPGTHQTWDPDGLKGIKPARTIKWRWGPGKSFLIKISF